MVAHLIPRHIHRRATEIAAPTAAGIADSGLTLQDVGTSTGLAIATVTDTADSSEETDADPFIVSTTMISATKSPTTSAAHSTSVAAAASGSSEESISMGTVIGACVGAFAGTAFLVFIGIWLYKRSSPKPRDPVSANNRNLHGEHARSRSRMEAWNKLPESKEADSWDGHQMKEADAQTIAPMEKLTMFKKSSPSIRTMYTHRSEELPVFDLDPHPFSQYHAGLAQELASSGISEPVKPFAGRQEQTASWDSGSMNDSFLSLKSGNVSSMSPSLDMARPTPALTSSTSDIHRWQSAEVLDFDGHKAEVYDEDPFNNPGERISRNNPFFSAQERSYITPPPPTRVDKGKGREIVQNPFSDGPSHTGHAAASSTDSNNDRAIQSLIAALGVPRGAAEDRLRIQSMQTINTIDSAYSDMTETFPHPPR